MKRCDEVKKNGDITHYPLNKNDDPTGSIVIWEHPVKDAPVGLYIIGVDPYDHDQSGTNSLGSCFVYKRFQGFEQYYDLIVAEYVSVFKTFSTPPIPSIGAYNIILTNITVKFCIC